MRARDPVWLSQHQISVVESLKWRLKSSRWKVLFIKVHLFFIFEKDLQEVLIFINWFFEHWILNKNRNEIFLNDVKFLRCFVLCTGYVIFDNIVEPIIQNGFMILVWFIFIIDCIYWLYVFQVSHNSNYCSPLVLYFPILAFLFANSLDLFLVYISQQYKTFCHLQSFLFERMQKVLCALYITCCCR